MLGAVEAVNYERISAGNRPAMINSMGCIFPLLCNHFAHSEFKDAQNTIIKSINNHRDFFSLSICKTRKS